MPALLDDLAALARALLAVPAALLPARWWDTFESLPIRGAAAISGLVTAVAGLVAGGRGHMAYLGRASNAAIDATFELTARQARGEAPPTDVTTFDLQRLSIFSFVAFSLTEQKVAEVLRRGVPYELPRLSRGPARLYPAGSQRDS